jgi:hypothetical protein
MRESGKHSKMRKWQALKITKKKIKIIKIREREHARDHAA